VLLPYGYHPVSSPPGYAIYYLWAMAGDQRQLAVYEDPAHRWIHDQP
jgi:5-deoxy-glucuronate isomerase